MSNIIEGITKDLKAIPKNLKAKAGGMDTKKLVLLNLPYIFVGYFCDKVAWLWRVSEGANASDKMMAVMNRFDKLFANPLPSFRLRDLLIGVAGGIALRLVVYYKAKNAKKFRQGVEYGSAKWGNAKDIEPYMDSVFENNVLLTQTERLMLSGRPKEPKYARNKNILVIGGSGSGKTRFFVKPNLMQMHSSYGGYDYSIMRADYKEIDGGVYDNPDVTIREALTDIIDDLKAAPDHNGAKGSIKEKDELIPIDYDGLMEKVEKANEVVQKNQESSIIADFRAKTNEMFHDISEMNPAEIKETIKCHVQAKIDEYDIDATIIDAVVVGSRCRGLEKDSSDLDVVVELSTNEREDDLFNAFNEDGLHIGEVKVDINPITAQRTGTLETYLPQAEKYLESIRQEREQELTQQMHTQGEMKKEEVEVTLMVSECGEVHNLGEFYENIPTVEEAIAIWKQIPPERMHGIPAIGINVHRPGEENYMDDEVDLLSGNRIDLEILEHIPSITSEPKAMEVIAELVAKLPEMEIDGVMSEDMEAKVWEKRMPDLEPAEQLAVEIDRFSYDYDVYSYRNNNLNMTESVSEISEMIVQGNTELITDWLNEVISEGALPDEMQRAKVLLEKLAEYKPLAKIEEMEEQNYNMIDNVLNNGAEKAQREENKKEQEQPVEKASLKLRLAEKKSKVVM